MSSSHDSIEASPIITDLLQPSHLPTQFNPTLSTRSPLNTNTIITIVHSSCRPNLFTRSSTPPPPPLDSPPTSWLGKDPHPRHVLTTHLTASLKWATQETVPGQVEKMKEELLARQHISAVRSKDWLFVSGHEVLVIVDEWEVMMAGGGLGGNGGEGKSDCSSG